MPVAGAEASYPLMAVMNGNLTNRTNKTVAIHPKPTQYGNKERRILVLDLQRIGDSGLENA